MINRELAKAYLIKADGKDFNIDSDIVEDINGVLENTIITMSKQTFPIAMWDIIINNCLGVEGVKTGLFQDKFTAFGKEYHKGDSLEEFLNFIEEYAIFNGEMDFIRNAFQLAQTMLNGLDAIKIVTDDSYFEAVIETAATDSEKSIWKKLKLDPSVFLVLYKKEDDVKFMIPFAIEKINGEPSLITKLGDNSLFETIATNTKPYLQEILELGSENQKHSCIYCGEPDLAKNLEYMTFADAYMCLDCLTRIGEEDLPVHFSIMFNDNPIQTLDNSLLGHKMYKTIGLVKTAHQKIRELNGIVFEADAIELISDTAAGKWNIPLKLKSEGCTLTEQNFYFGDIVPSIVEDIIKDMGKLPTTAFNIILSGSLTKENYEFVTRELFELQFMDEIEKRIDSLSMHSQCLEVRGLQDEY